MPLSPGEKLGPYEILSALGAGGMGEVHKARDTRLDRTVAVKVLPEHIEKRDDLRARFEREARAVASLNHPHICVLHDIGPGYMVMELIEGESLAARIEKGAVPLDQALKHATQIADALDRAHRAGVTHRDVKPQNIMLTRDGVKVLDFGLAKSQARPGPTEETLTAVLTTEGTIMGTPQYMAPEQFEGKEADARSDIWAFGAVLYEMVTGQKAFQGKSYASLLGAILSADPPPMAVQPLTPAWLERLVKRCLQKDPDDRYQSMRDVVLDLRTPPPEAAFAAPSKVARWPWAVAGAAILLAVFGSWVTMSMARKATSEPPVRLSIVPPENGTITAFTISPDGRRIAFPVAKDGESRIWVRHLESDTALPIPGTEGAGATEAPAWSPDGEQLAFVADEMLKLVSVQSGKVKDLTRARNRGIAWNTDDVILFVDFEQTIRRISAAGGSPEKVKLDLGGARGARFPCFFPDQNRFIYVTREAGFVGDQISSIRVGSLDGKTNKSILAQRSKAELVVDPGGAFGWLLYVRDESLFAHRFNLESLELEDKPVGLSDAVGYAVGGTGRSFFSAHGRLVAYRAPETSGVRLVWFDPSGKRLQEAGGPQRRFGQLRLSPDGRQALADRLFERGRGASSIESIDLVSWSANRRTFDAPSRDALWSPDGKTIYFSAYKNHREEVYQTPADWSTPPVLVQSSTEPVFLSDYHPAHQTLLLYTGLDRARTLKRSSSGWEPGKFPDPDEPFAKGRFSPDGRWVAYQAGTAVAGVFAMAYPPTGAKWQISPDGAEPCWRRDGKELYYIRGNEIMAVSLDVSGRALKAGTPRSLFRTALPPASSPSHRFDVAPDGKFLVMEPVAEPPGVPFSVLLNWQSLLRKP
jgi:Tol biopolymer transport system component